MTVVQLFPRPANIEATVESYVESMAYDIALELDVMLSTMQELLELDERILYLVGKEFDYNSIRHVVSDIIAKKQSGAD